MDEKSIRVQAVFTPELHRQFQKAAKLERRTPSAMLRVMVEYYLMEKSDRERFELGNTGGKNE